MRVLITSSRFPHAVAEVRKFGSEGHSVFAADTFWTSPGAHSRYVSKALRYASPSLDTARFVEDVARAIERERIDLVVPQCEEAFFLARYARDLPKSAALFCAPFETLAQLHDKSRFAALAASLGLRTPRTQVARSDAELHAAAASFAEYIARPAFSRAGTRIVSNNARHGTHDRLRECRPSAEAPWIVQEFVHGTEVCSFSVARHGRVEAHCAYVHPKVIENSGGISYVSVDEPESLAIAQAIVSALDYHGQISFDYIRTREGLVLLECNPRPTAGVTMMRAADLVGAVVGPRRARPAVVPAGEREHIGTALVRDMLHDWRAIPSDLAALFSGVEDVYLQKHDRMPGLFQFLSYLHVLAYRRHEKRRERRRTDLIDAQFFDIAWDGAPIG